MARLKLPLTPVALRIAAGRTLFSFGPTSTANHASISASRSRDQPDWCRHSLTEIALIREVGDGKRDGVIQVEKEEETKPAQRNRHHFL